MKCPVLTNITKSAFTSLFFLTLAGCSDFSILPKVHKISIQQGNIVEQKMVNQLKPNMTKSQVRYVLGTPLIADTFDQQRWDYYYSKTLKAGNYDVTTFSVIFEHDMLISIKGEDLELPSAWQQKAVKKAEAAENSL